MIQSYEVSTLIKVMTLIGNESNRCPWKRKLIKSWMHGWPSQCVMLLRLSCSVCCARALEGLVRAGSAALGPRRAREREARASVKWGASVDRGQRAALTLKSPPPAPPQHTSQRSPRSHIIYDSIRAPSKLAILYLPTNNNSFFLSRDYFFCSDM